MRDRLSDDEITSIVGSIIQGEELGTPLARLFRTQADVLRIKRTQRAETIAGEAGVKMLLPAVLVVKTTTLLKGIASVGAKLTTILVELEPARLKGVPDKIV